MRYIIKGGVWKNSEDEILKAAVMKYGLNQWSRISSLLVRKSAKQCKQRWYEWLDPSIKKTEWTREEEEKLLHLAKIFPSQWRTIAPIVGRTPMQCVEKYERLLDQAQGKDSNDPNDPRRLRPGEIDPNPETKPARPDPIDMDEDEKEMLAEARVRLANTKGKKAKRKARGKMIEEARRLAFLQKKRELKAAGIEFVNHRIEKVQKGIDYNAEIAFERMVPNFVFKPPDEENPQPDKTITNVSLQVLEGRRRDEEEESKRKIDQRRLKKLKERELEQAVNMHNKTATFFQVKSKMQLPDPQLKDQDLELLGKLNAVNEVSEYATYATRALVGNYSQREGNLSVMRTPKAPNTVMREAQNILALQQTETPLVGGENQPLNNSGQISSTRMGRTPMSQLVSTPNALARMLRTPNQQMLGKTGGMTPASGGRSVRGGILSESGPGATPIHDAFKLNEEFDPSWEEQSQQPSLSKMNPNQIQLQRALHMRQVIKTGLSNLPKPKNEFSLIIPELQDEDALNKNKDLVDAEDLVVAENRIQKELTLKHYQQRTQAFQKNLMPPRTLPTQPLYQESEETVRNDIEKILQDTVLQLIQEDLEDQGTLVGSTPEAEALLAQETQLLKSKYGCNLEQLDEKWNNIRNNIEFDPYSGKFVNLMIANEEKKLAVLKASYLRKRGILDKLTKRSDNLELKIKTILKGYEMRMEGLQNQISKLYQTLNDVETEIQVYQQALWHERHRYLDRVDEMSKFHDMLLVKENELQLRHEELTKEKVEIELEDDLFQ